eukprot:scaffold31586_cov96-Isochrysis_galbana.AAC.1
MGGMASCSTAEDKIHPCCTVSGILWDGGGEWPPVPKASPTPRRGGKGDLSQVPTGPLHRNLFRGTVGMPPAQARPRAVPGAVDVARSLGRGRQARRHRRHSHVRPRSQESARPGHGLGRHHALLWGAGRARRRRYMVRHAGARPAFGSILPPAFAPHAEDVHPEFARVTGGAEVVGGG